MNGELFWVLFNIVIVLLLDEAWDLVKQRLIVWRYNIRLIEKCVQISTLSPNRLECSTPIYALLGSFIAQGISCFKQPDNGWANTSSNLSSNVVPLYFVISCFVKIYGISSVLSDQWGIHISFAAEFGDYDSPDISENYLEGFKVCPDQVSHHISRYRMHGIGLIGIISTQSLMSPLGYLYKQIHRFIEQLS